MSDAMDQIAEIADRVMWRDITTAPKDRFILLWCAEDESTWWAKWQDRRWHGVDEHGLTRSGSSAGDVAVVTGWKVEAWMPIPAAPPKVQD